MKFKYSVGERLDVEIKKIVPQGRGLAFADGITIFVPLSAVGDKVSVRIEQIKGKVAFAEIEEVLTPSHERVEPPCPYFSKCGGCNMQQMNYAEQLRVKADIVDDSLRRIGKIVPEGPIKIIAGAEPFGYRSRAMWHIETRGGSVGYYRRNTRDLVDIENCLILVPELNKALEELREDLSPERFFSERVSIEAAAGGDGSVSVFSPELAEPTIDISVSAGGERFVYSARNFFQGNRYLLDTMIELAVGGTEGRLALDLYCGVGFFTLPLARRFEQVIGVEGSERAIEYAEKNRELARLENVDLYAENVREFLASDEMREAGRPDLILLDPPRAGTEKAVIAAIIDLAPAEISYVSCEPAGLARDLRKLIDAGYSISSITAIDLFPQTHHVETIVRLVRIED